VTAILGEVPHQVDVGYQGIVASLGLPGRHSRDALVHQGCHEATPQYRFRIALGVRPQRRAELLLGQAVLAGVADGFLLDRFVQACHNHVELISSHVPKHFIGTFGNPQSRCESAR
jgi:hypothetical protein